MKRSRQNMVQSTLRYSSGGRWHNSKSHNVDKRVSLKLIEKSKRSRALDRNPVRYQYEVYFEINNLQNLFQNVSVPMKRSRQNMVRSTLLYNSGGVGTILDRFGHQVLPLSVDLEAVGKGF